MGDELRIGIGVAWVTLCAAAALLLRVGAALQQAGLVRSKNAASASMRLALDAAVVAIVLWAVGGAILFQRTSPYLAINPRLLLGPPFADPQLFATLFLVVASTLLATGALWGATAERSRFLPVLAAASLLAAVVVPVAGQWAWFGWLHRLGFHDLAGASVFHLTGGLCALAAARAVGPRSNKYNRDGSANAIPGHSLPLASAGTLLSAAAWVPCVLGFLLAATYPAAGSASDRTPALASAGFVALNVLLAGAAGTLTALALCQVRYGKPDVHLTYASLLGALVAVSAGADRFTGLSAVAVGAVAGLITPTLILAIDLYWKIDDPTSAVAVHAGGGAWGTLAAGLFAPVASFADKLQATGAQLAGLAAVAAVALALSLTLFALLKRVTPLRAREADEYDGLDLAEHDIGAYPDFQQTMIKSYHLREA